MVMQSLDSNGKEDSLLPEIHQTLDGRTYQTVDDRAQNRVSEFDEDMNPVRDSMEHERIGAGLFTKESQAKPSCSMI